MDVLVEVHDEKELELALAADSRLIGINNRNLQDFSMDLNTTFRLKKMIPAGIPVVSESGLRDQADIRRLEEAGYVIITKEFVGKIPRTVIELSENGRTALENYLADMKQVIEGISSDIL